AELAPLTVPEVRELLLRLVWDRLTPAERALARSEWRRRHRHRARRCHYRRHGARPPNRPTTAVGLARPRRSDRIKIANFANFCRITLLVTLSRLRRVLRLVSSLVRRAESLPESRFELN